MFYTVYINKTSQSRHCYHYNEVLDKPSCNAHHYSLLKSSNSLTMYIYHNLTWHLTINCIDIVVCLLFNTPSEGLYILRYLLYSSKIACVEVFYHTNDFLLYKKYLDHNNQNLLVWDPKYRYGKHLSFHMVLDTNLYLYLV